MVNEHPWVCDQTTQHATGLAHTHTAKLEIAETAGLEHGEVGVVCGEERVEGHGEDVDDGAAMLALPVKGAQGG